MHFIDYFLHSTQWLIAKASHVMYLFITKKIELTFILLILSL